MTSYIPARYVFCLMIYLSWFNVTLLRTNVNIAILSMVNSTKSEDNSSRSDVDISQMVCEGNDTTLYEATGNLGTLLWNPVVQGLVLGCYFYGYIFTSVAGPWVAKIIGFKTVVGGAMAVSSILTLISPFAANHSYQLFVAFRILIGFFQGAVIPASVTGFPVWVPAKEEPVVISFLTSGLLLGYFVTLQMSSIIAQYLNWESVFYITGSFPLLWSIFWFMLIHNIPEEHPRISEKELKYLQKHYRTSQLNKKRKAHVPWLKILTSLPYWAVNFCHLGLDWTRATVTTLLPAYATQVLQMNLTTAGALSGSPYVVAIPVALICGKLFDILIQRTTLRKITIRKLFSITALVGSSTFTLLTFYAGCNKCLIIVCVFLTVSLNIFHVAGTLANNFDLSPSHCGILMGITQTVSMSSGFLAPQIAGYILTQQDIVSGWKTIFWMNAGINIFSAVFFFIFGSSEEQPWSKISLQENEETESNPDVSKLITTTLV